MMDSKYRDWIRANAPKAKDKEEFIKSCVARFGKGRNLVRCTLNDMLRRGEDLGPVVSLKSPAGVPRRAPRDVRGNFRLSVDVSEIKKEYDEEAKILEGVQALGTRLIKDNDFRMELSVPVDRWKVVSGLPKFNSYKKELKGKRFRGVYWGSPDVIKELEKKIDMLP